MTESPVRDGSAPATKVLGGEGVVTVGGQKHGAGAAGFHRPRTEELVQLGCERQELGLSLRARLLQKIQPPSVTRTASVVALASPERSVSSAGPMPAK